MTAMIDATIATSSDIGKRVAISAMTGLPDHIELPRLKVTRPQRKSRYCRIQGRSMPISAWHAASASAVKLVPPDPRRTRQMSPGTRRINMKTSVAAPNRVGIVNRSRLMM